MEKGKKLMIWTLEEMKMIAGGSDLAHSHLAMHSVVGQRGDADRKGATQNQLELLSTSMGVIDERGTLHE
jgi:hypothetical protein